jgi:hypothetical protein
MLGVLWTYGDLTQSTPPPPRSLRGLAGQLAENFSRGLAKPQGHEQNAGKNYGRPSHVVHGWNSLNQSLNGSSMLAAQTLPREEAEEEAFLPPTR